MIDGNISMEEDTELRDLVVQTLENNGVLAKVRAELRASLFLTLEEQESVLNPEPSLNHSVKQYLTRPEGKLLFSLVREFLEYFGLNYTMSVYDPETYSGKEYKYEGRKKLSQQLGIESKEPLIGEILKNAINSALNHSQKITDCKLDNSETSINNTTFNVSVPKVLQQNDSLSNEESKSDSTVPNDVDPLKRTVDIDMKKALLNSINQNNETDAFSSASHDKLITTKPDIHYNKEQVKNKNNTNEFQNRNNVKNEGKLQTVNNLQRTVYFDKVVVDGLTEKVGTRTKDEALLLGELPLFNNCSLKDLPPLSDKKANMNDLKELMDIAQGVSQYEDNLTPHTSVNIEEPSSSSSQIEFDLPAPKSAENSKAEREEIKQISSSKS